MQIPRMQIQNPLKRTAPAPSTPSRIQTLSQLLPLSLATRGDRPQPDAPSSTSALNSSTDHQPLMIRRSTMMTSTRFIPRPSRLTLALKALTLTLTLATVLHCGSVQAAPNDKAGDKAQVTLNLKDADINTLIATVSEVTGKNFIVDPRVKGKITVISATPMDAAGVYETFLAVLQVNGFATVPAGEAIKVVPEVTARQDGGTYVSAGKGLALDEIVTHVYEVQHASAAQLVGILRPLVAQSGQVAAYAPGNMLIISDRASNIIRMGKLISQIDSSGDRDIEMVPLENAAAGEVVKVLTGVQQQDKQADPSARPTTVLADERSNSVLLGGDKSDRQRMRDIIAELDQPLKEDSYTQVIFLQHALAENLVPILQGYAQNSSRSDSKSSILGNSSGGSFGGGGGIGSRAGSLAGGLSGGGGGLDSGGSSSLSSSSASGGAAGGASQIFEHTTIVADRDTNALVVSAPPKTMRLLRSVISQLDIQRAQVLVEAIIAEVSASRSSDLGIDWIAYNPNSVAAAGILNSSTSSALSTAATALASSSSSSSSISSSTIASAAAGLVGTGVTAVVGGTTAGGAFYGALLKALRSDGDSNIVSTPSTMVLDNQEAKITVVQNVPVLTGQFSNTGSSSNGSVNPFQTFDSKDVGLKLGVTPTITSGNNAMQLKIEIENSNVQSGSAGTASLVTNKRTISTAVTVEDGRILVLGGLMDDQLNDSKNRIPLLSSIPLLGSLFQSRSIAKTKRNLMVFLHPSIVRDPGEADYYTRIKYNNVRQAQIGAATGAVPVIGGERPQLFDYDEYLKHNIRQNSGPISTAPAPESADGTPRAVGPGTPIDAPSSAPETTTPAN